MGTIDASTFHFADEEAENADRLIPASSFKFDDEDTSQPAPAPDGEKVERSKADIMRLRWQGETGQEGSAGRYAFAKLVPFAGGDFEQKQKEKLTRMKDFADGKPHLQKRMVKNDAVLGGYQEMTPEQAALGRSMIYDPEERHDTLDDMWADEAMYLGVPREDAVRGDGEKRGDYMKRIRGIVSSRLEEAVGRQESARRELENTDETITDKIVVGGMPSIGYVGEMAAGGALMKGAQGARLGFNLLTKEGLKQLFTKEGAKEFGKVAGKRLAVDSAKSMPATMAGTVRGMQEFGRDEYGLDDNGHVVVTAEGDKGNTLGKAFRNSFTENLLENAVGEISRPLAGRLFGIIGKKGGTIGRFANRAYQAYNRAAEVTGFGDMLFEEMPEENVQYFFSDVLGWGKKDSEYRGVMDELRHAFTDKDGQYTLSGQWNTMLAMMMQMGAQAAYAGGKTAFERIDAKRDIGNQLQGICGLTKEQVGGMSLEQRAAFADAWNAFSDNPAALKAALEKAGNYLGANADELARQSSYKLEKSIHDYGETPRRFQIQTEQGPNGKPRPKFEKSIHLDGTTGESSVRNEMYDPASGVTIIDDGVDKNGDAVYEVCDEIHPGRSISADSFDEALTIAHVFALQNQKQYLDNRRKEEYARILTEGKNAKFKRPAVFVDNEADALRLIQNGIRQNNGSFLGVRNLSEVFATGADKKVSLPLMLKGGVRSAGFVTPDGTIVAVLSNVQSPADMNRLLAHESGHSAGRGEGGDKKARLEMLRNVSPNTEFGKMLAQNRQANEDSGGKWSDDYVLDETFSHWLEKRGHNPSVMQRIRHAVLGKVGKLNDADLEVIASRIESESANANGAIEFVPAVANAESIPVEPKSEAQNAPEETAVQQTPTANGQEAAVEAPGERGEVQTGKETPKPTEAPTGDSGASGDVPRRQATVEEVVASSKTPFTDAEKATLESAADVSGIDETVEMPKNAAPLSFLSSEAHIVRLNPAKIDRSDAILPNMKKDANRKSGITKPLSGEWHPTMGGVGAVWLTKDGKLTVITGRHRSELAERKGKSMLYYLFREADGFTKENAMIYDAVANIHDEKGTINDYLGFLDKTKPTRDEAEKAGILYGKGLVAWSLYRDATDAVRNATATDGNPGEGQISPQQATVIAEAAPRDADKRNPSIQRQLLKTALGGMRGKAFDMYARIRADELSRTPLNENLLVGEQMDLFSSPEDQAADILAQRQSQYRTKKAQGYQTVAQNLRAALNKEGKLELTDEYAKDLGVTDKSDKKQLEAAYDKAVERANYWENTVRLEDADKTAMDAEINAAADAKAKRLAELKAKREAVKSGKPKVVVSKNATTTPADETKPPAGETKPAAGETKKPVSETQKPVSETQKPALGTENAVSETKTAKKEMSKSASKTPSIKMKDEAAEKKAKAALDAIDFDTSDLSADSTILSGDEVRKTMPGYNRLDWSTHVDRTGYVGPRMESQFQRLLKERKGKGNGTVVFLAGGNGAGKSTAAKAPAVLKADFVIDSTLGNLEVAKKQIDAILANGQTPDIRFVYRTPGQALEGIEQRVKNGGHIVSPLSFANSHVKSRENLRLLSEAYGDKIYIHIYDNSVEGAPEITLEQLEAKRKIDHARIRESANYHLGHLREREEARVRSQGGAAGSGAGGRGVEGNTGGVAGGGATGEAQQVDFDTPDFDPEKFGKLVTGVGKLVDVLVESGHKDFKALATYIYEQDAAKYERAKPVLRNVWNQIADLRGLDEVSRKDADDTFKTIER